jgi:hypothetical protein
MFAIPRQQSGDHVAFVSEVVMDARFTDADRIAQVLETHSIQSATLDEVLGDIQKSISHRR